MYGDRVIAILLRRRASSAAIPPHRYRWVADAGVTRSSSPSVITISAPPRAWMTPRIRRCMSILSSPVTFAPSSVRRISGLAVKVENHSQRLLVLQQEELVRKLAREVEAARASADDKPEPGDHSVGDKGRAYFTLAQSDSQLLANVRGPGRSRTHDSLTLHGRGSCGNRP